MLIRLQALAELRALFRTKPAFRQVFLADFATQVGDGGLLIAFPMLILEQTHDVTLTGLAFSGEILAFGLLSPVAGYWADRLEQKRVMIAANVARVALMGLLLIALALKWPLAVFLALSVLMGAAGSFFMPARAAFLRRLLEGDWLERAIALEGTMSFLLRLIAPALMGLLLAFAPATVGLQVNMVAYCVAVALLAPAWVRGSVPVTVSPAESSDADWREGWRFVARSSELRHLMTLDVLMSVVGMAAFSITVALLEQVLHLPAQSNGWLLATTGLAGAIGAMAATRLGQSRVVYLGLTTAIALTYLMVPFASTLSVLMAMWMVRGLAIGAFCVLMNQRIAALVPAPIMGRVQAAWGLAACLAAFFGSAATPWLLRSLGAAQSYTLFGTMLTAIAVYLAASVVFDRVRSSGPVLVENS